MVHNLLSMINNIKVKLYMFRYVALLFRIPIYFIPFLIMLILVISINSFILIITCLATPLAFISTGSKEGMNAHFEEIERIWNTLVEGVVDTFKWYLLID